MYQGHSSIQLSVSQKPFLCYFERLWHWCVADGKEEQLWCRNNFHPFAFEFSLWDCSSFLSISTVVKNSDYDAWGVIVQMWKSEELFFFFFLIKWNHKEVWSFWSFLFIVVPVWSYWGLALGSTLSEDFLKCFENLSSLTMHLQLRLRLFLYHQRFSHSYIY